MALIANWRIFSLPGGTPAKKNICAAQDALVFAIGSWIQQCRNRCGKSLEEVAEDVSKAMSKSVDYAEVSAVEHGDWHFDKRFIAEILRQVKIKNPDAVAEIIEKLESVGRSIQKTVVQDVA